MQANLKERLIDLFNRHPQAFNPSPSQIEVMNEWHEENPEWLLQLVEQSIHMGIQSNNIYEAQKHRAQLIDYYQTFYGKEMVDKTVEKDKVVTIDTLYLPPNTAYQTDILQFIFEKDTKFTITAYEETDDGRRQVPTCFKTAYVVPNLKHASLKADGVIPAGNAFMIMQLISSPRSKGIVYYWYTINNTRFEGKIITQF